MAIKLCKNIKCNKKVKSRSLKRKFCSHSCYIQHKKDNIKLYTGFFKKGQASWNKGLKLTPIGAYMIRTETLKSGNVKRLRFINIGDENGEIKYVRNDKYVWEKANGTVPSKHVIYHKDGRSLNDELENLECITINEALSRYRNLREEVYDLSDTKDVTKIIKGCIVGDKRMQKLLFEMTYGDCMTIAMRYSKDEAAAQDILNDAFVKIFSKLHTFSNDGAFEGWIKRIVINTSIDAVRVSKKTLNFESKTFTYLNDTINEDSDNESGESNHFDFALDEDEEIDEEEEIKNLPTEEIIQEIQHLSNAYRTVFNMFVFEEMSHAEIAEKLGISVGTSKSNYAKAKMILRKRLHEKIRNSKVAQQNTIFKLEVPSLVH